MHTLPAGDAGGTVSFLVVMALIIGGYLSSTIGMAFGGRAKPRRRLVSLATASIASALLTDLFAGPILGAIPTSKFLTLWGVFVPVMMAVAYATAALQAVLGAAGTLVRPVPARRGRHDGRTQHHLLRRQRHDEVAPHPRRVSRGGSVGREHGQETGAERCGRRGRSIGRRGSRGLTNRPQHAAERFLRITLLV